MPQLIHFKIYGNQPHNPGSTGSALLNFTHCYMSGIKNRNATFIQPCLRPLVKCVLK